MHVKPTDYRWIWLGPTIVAIYSVGRAWQPSRSAVWIGEVAARKDQLPTGVG